MKTRIAKYGNSLHLRIPAEIADVIKFDFDKEYDLEFAVDNGDLVFTLRG